MAYDLPWSETGQDVLRRRQRFMKRLLDVSFSSALLLGCAPLMALITLLIWLGDDGPVFFAQPRIGEGGRIFTMYKFRTMIALAPPSAEPHGLEEALALHKRRDDPRVTRLGRLLRATSLDELPQFYNVLRGDMSLVGPRPELPWLVAQYEPWQYRRLSVPQGITGLWQINGRAEKPMHLHTAIDIDYLENYSFWLDLVILLKTAPAILRGNGAY